LGDIDIDGRIILKLVLENKVWKMQTGFEVSQHGAQLQAFVIIVMNARIRKTKFLDQQNNCQLHKEDPVL
jgi:hypothetical protein